LVVENFQITNWFATKIIELQLNEQLTDEFGAISTQHKNELKLLQIHQ
jgi:hypothetical protein